MGYSTSYNGSVKIVPELTATGLNAVRTVIEESIGHTEMSWALQITRDFTGICWRGGEKTYDFEHTLNALIVTMKSKGYTFDLEGEFEYQGEEPNDRGYIRKVDGKFARVEKKLQADEYKCPDCGHVFKP